RDAREPGIGQRDRELDRRARTPAHPAGRRPDQWGPAPVRAAEEPGRRAAHPSLAPHTRRGGHRTHRAQADGTYTGAVMNRSGPQAGLRNIPSVDRVLRELGETGLPRPLVVATVRRELADVREEKIASDGLVMTRVRAALDDLRRARIQPVING